MYQAPGNAYGVYCYRGGVQAVTGGEDEDHMLLAKDKHNIGVDRHAIIVQPGAGSIWEMWLAKLAIISTK